MTKIEAADAAYATHFNEVYEPARNAYLVDRTMGDDEYLAIRAEHKRLLAEWEALFEETAA